MRSTLFIFFLLLSYPLFAQPSIEALIQAERSFATMAARTGTRRAFLSFLDSNSIVFHQGEIRNGYTRWSSELQEDNSLLLWRPEFAVISASGDFGCTMGPSEYRENRAGNTAGYYGHFASLWRRNRSGSWKVLCDIGVPHNDPAAEENRVVRRSLDRGGVTRLDTATAPVREQAFMQACKAGGKDLLKEYSTPDAWILLAGRQPVRSREMDDFDETVPGHYQFEPAGHWFSPAGDMLVSYGSTLSNQKKANYMLVWIAERGKWLLMMVAMN